MFRSPRPACGERSDCEAIRVRGSHRTHLCSEFAEAGPSPQPSPREERGEGEVIDRHRLNLNASRFKREAKSYFGGRCGLEPARRRPRTVNDRLATELQTIEIN